MAVVVNFYFFIFLRLMWKFLDLESERGNSVCWSNNKIIDYSMKQILGTPLHNFWLNYPSSDKLDVVYVLFTY